MKRRHSRAFWWLTGLYFFAFTLLCVGFKPFFDWIASMGAQLTGIWQDLLPIFHFEDIWQNMAYLIKLMKISLAFVVIISITNDFNYKTLRQEIVDGWSRQDFVASKLLLVAVLTLLASLWMLILGLILGAMYSPVQEAEAVFRNMHFVAVFGLDLMAYLCLSLFLGTLLKRPGLTIAILFTYSVILEPISAFFIGDPINRFLPINAISNLIHSPFKKYVFLEVQDYVLWSDVAIVIGYVLLFIGGTYALLRYRDLK
ncbi:MAG: hypothetical protein AAGB22_01285 [Bacteroidota bacterium]